jgi:hypothetical protein
MKNEDLDFDTSRWGSVLYVYTEGRLSGLISLIKKPRGRLIYALYVVILIFFSLKHFPF